MKKLLTIAVLLMGIQAFAQNVKVSVEDRSRYRMHSVKWNLKEKIGYADGDNIIQIEKTGINQAQFAYTARYNAQKHALIIHKTDASGNEIATNKLENGERNFGPVTSQSIEFDGKILLFYFRYLEKDSMKLYLSELDRKSLSLTNTQYLFGYPQGNSGLFKMGKEFRKEIVLRTSPDSSKLLVVVHGKKEEVFACVFEKGLRLARKKAYPVAGTDGQLINAAFIDNSGNGILAFSEENVTSTSFDNTTVKNLLTLSPSNTARLIDMSAMGGESTLHNIQMEVSRDQSKLFMFGDYSGVVANAGIWLMEVSAVNFRIGKPRMIPYPEDFMKRVHSLGFAERKRSEYGILGVLYELAEFDNGDLILCGTPMERADKTYMNMNNSGMGGYIMLYAGPVIMSFLNGKKDVVFSMIPRHQNFCDGSLSAYLPYKDKLLVFYNDYEKNINGTLLPDDVHQKGGAFVKELSLGYAVVKKDGTVESRKLLAEGVSRMNYFNTGEVEKESDHKLLFPSASLDKKTGDQKVAVVTIDQ